MTRLAIFFGLICTATLVGQSVVDRAWNLAAKGERDTAIQLLHQAVAKDPSSADARLLLGSLLSERGNGAEAIEQLTAAVRLKPKSAEAQNALGEAYSAVGNAKAARGPFESALALDPSFKAAELNLGALLLEIGETATGVKHLDRAIRMLGKDPEAAYAHYLRAKAYSASSDLQSAARELEQAVALRPAYPEAWSDLGQVRKLMLDDTGALAAGKRAVELHPSDAIAQYRLGAVYLSLDQPQAAVEHLRESYRINPEDQSTINALQTALRRTGETEEANALKRKLTEMLRRKDQANQDAIEAVKLNNEGAQLEKEHNLSAAVARYQKAVALYPSHVGIRVNYAVALLRSGRWKEGLDQMHDALERDPANPQIRSAFTDALKQAPPGSIPHWDDSATRSVP